MDDNTVAAIYKAIPNSKYDDQQQGWVFPTSTRPSQLPVVKFAVGGQEFAVPKSALAFAETGDGNYCKILTNSCSCATNTLQMVVSKAEEV